MEAEQMPDYTYPETPECDKALSVKDKSWALGEFLDWLDSKQYWIAHYPPMGMWGLRAEELCPVRRAKEDLLAEFFGIDLKAMEAEKQAVLASIRTQGAKP